MNKCLLIVTSTLLLTASVSAQEAVWQEFTSKEGGFKVLLPGMPRQQEQKVRSPVGPLVNHAFIATSAKEDTVYLVSYADYPEDALKQHTPEQILDAARSGTLVNLKGKLVSDQKITLDKTHPGREFLIEVPGAADYRARIFFANKRLYQVVFVTSVKELAAAEATQKYFDSFGLTSK